MTNLCFQVIGIEAVSDFFILAIKNTVGCQMVGAWKSIKKISLIMVTIIVLAIPFALSKADN